MVWRLDRTDPVPLYDQANTQAGKSVYNTKRYTPASIAVL